MANHSSAIKRNRQRIKRTVRNRAVKSALRTTLKRARTAATAGTEDATTLARDAASELDRAAKKGIIPANRAARVKSRVARAAHQATAPKK
jgi:small subunit ribosomal protein S20